MSNIATIQQNRNAVATMDENTALRVMQESLYPGAAPESVAMVLSYCKARGLDPMLKPVHIVPMYIKDVATGQSGMRDVVLPGIPLYRIQAARTGTYAGKTEPEFGPDQTRKLGGVEVVYPLWCKITVTKLVDGKERQFTAKEFWLENYATAKRDTDAPNAMWKKRAYGQLAKCTEAQALRQAFPEETGGEATAEEMDGKVLGDTYREPPHSGGTIEAQVEPAKPEGPSFGNRVDKLLGMLPNATTLDQISRQEGKMAGLLAELKAASRTDLIDRVNKALADARAALVPPSEDDGLGDLP